MKSANNDEDQEIGKPVKNEKRLKGSNSKPKRMQFDFSEQSVKRLEALLELSEASSKSEVIRQALRLYEFFLDKKHDSYEFYLEKEETKIKIELVGI